MSAVDHAFAHLLREAASGVDDPDAYWKGIDELRVHPVDEVWARVAPLADHPDPRLQALVPDVLRYLPHRTEVHVDQTIALLRGMLSSPRDDSVIAAIGTAFVDLDRPKAALELMLPYVDHASPDVRRAVVHALLGITDPRAVAALLELSGDDDAGIRDWATFGLGSQLGEPGDRDFVDTRALRDALAARLDDTCDDARAEAIVGLAMRKDPRAIAAIARELSGGPFGTLVLEAAKWAGDPTLCPALRALALDEELMKTFDEQERRNLTDAIDACSRT